LFSRHPVPDAAKLVFYRPEYYGSWAKEFTQEAMRGGFEVLSSDDFKAGAEYLLKRGYR
jgi:hypothetical protein